MEITLRMDGDMHLHFATIQKLSRFGVWLTNLRKEAKLGTALELAMPLSPAGLVVTTGMVVHVIDAAAAARHHLAPGVIVRFRQALAERDLATPLDLHSAEPTHEIASAQLGDLIAECRAQMFAGSLADLALPTVLSMLEGARKSGRLALAHERITAAVDLLDGRVVDAQWSEAPAGPRDILMSVLDWHDGTFELFAAIPIARDIYLASSVAELLIDSARLRDEAERRALSPPKLDAPDHLVHRKRRHVTAHPD